MLYFEFLHHCYLPACLPGCIFESCSANHNRTLIRRLRERSRGNRQRYDWRRRNNRRCGLVSRQNTFHRIYPNLHGYIDKKISRVSSNLLRALSPLDALKSRLCKFVEGTRQRYDCKRRNHRWWELASKG